MAASLKALYMAKSPAHVYKMKHHLGAKMKKGGLMHVRMKKTNDEPDSDGMDSYEEEMAEQVAAPTPGAPAVPPKSKARKHIEYLKERRRVVT